MIHIDGTDLIAQLDAHGWVQGEWEDGSGYGYGSGSGDGSGYSSGYSSGYGDGYGGGPARCRS